MMTKIGNEMTQDEILSAAIDDAVQNSKILKKWNKHPKTNTIFMKNDIWIWINSFSLFNKKGKELDESTRFRIEFVNIVEVGGKSTGFSYPYEIKHMSRNIDRAIIEAKNDYLKKVKSQAEEALK